MKILVIGATGQLGGDLLRNNPGHQIDAPERGVLDIAESVVTADYIRRTTPDAVINCAAFHNVPQCEEEPERAFRINCVAVRDLAAVCQETGAWLITFSSDYVFDGCKRSPYSEDDLPGPLQIYGITRLAGENAALAGAPDRTVIIRTCGLYGTSGAKSKGGNFVDKCVEMARTNSLMEMGSDQTVAPTSTADLSHAVFSLLVHPQLRSGIYHLVNEGECTWYELTKAIVKLLALKTEVRPVDRGGRTGAMRRPLYSVLGNQKAQSMGIVLPRWQSALEEYLRAKYPAASERTGSGA